MIRLLLLLVIISVGNAFADTVPFINTGYSVGTCDPAGHPEDNSSSKALACSKAMGRFNSNPVCLEGRPAYYTSIVYSEDGGPAGAGLCQWSRTPADGENPAAALSRPYLMPGATVCPEGYIRDNVAKNCKKPECPAGQTWSILSNRCVTPCVGNQTSTETDDTCKCDTTRLNNKTGDRPWFEGDGPIPKQLCDGGCLRDTGFGLGGGKKYAVQGGAFTGQTCTGQPDLLPEKPPTPNHKPQCDASEGVMTSSSGTVACVPEGTPDGRKPVVKKETKNETFPDGSQKNTETTKTKDPATGAEDTQSKTTTYPKPDGTQGQAGPVGTGNTSGSTGGTGGGGGGNCKEGENCNDEECDPTLNFCGGPAVEGVYTKKDKTAEGPLQAFASGVRSSLLGEKAAGFFTVNIPTAGCPNWAVDVPYLKTRVDVSQYMCSSAALAAMNIVGTVLMVVAAFAAFRWAML